jgi:hypothetical protein
MQPEYLNLMQVMTLIDDLHRREAGREAIGSVEPIVMGSKDDRRFVSPYYGGGEEQNSRHDDRLKQCTEHENLLPVQ